MTMLTVELSDHEETFEGEWLVEPDRDETRAGEEGFDAGTYYGVAKTKGGSYAVYVAHRNDGWGPHFDVFDDLEEVRLPENIVTAARSAEGERFTIHRDI